MNTNRVSQWLTSNMIMLHEVTSGDVGAYNTNFMDEFFSNALKLIKYKNVFLKTVKKLLISECNR